MLRRTGELAQPAATDIEQKLIDAVLRAVAPCRHCVAVDYAKGVLTARVIRNVIDARASSANRDRRSQERQFFAIYRGATLLTPTARSSRKLPEVGRIRTRASRAAQDAMQLAELRGDPGDAKRHAWTLVPVRRDHHIRPIR